MDPHAAETVLVPATGEGGWQWYDDDELVPLLVDLEGNVRTVIFF